jgi:competence protein ComEC
MKRCPLLAMGAAAAAGASVTQPVDAMVRILLLLAVAAFVMHVLLRRDTERIRSLSVFALVAGAASGTLHNFVRVDVPIRAHTTRVACTVLEAGQSGVGMSAFTCVADNGATLAVEAIANAPAVGTHVLVRGRLEPFDAPRNPGEPDERMIQRERGIDLRLTSARVITRLPPARPTLKTELAMAHSWALEQLRARMQEPFTAILAGELWSARGMLPPELRSEFQETGTVHILVTAGLHLGVVALVTMSLLRAFTVPRLAASGIAITVIWAYAVFSGLHLPAMRAALMISFALCAYAAGASAKSWNAYGIALGAFALFLPQSVCSASFVLSFSCVGAILLLADELAKLLEHVALPDNVKEALVLTAATQIGTWPLTASIFLMVSPYALLANLLVVPVVGFTMIIAGAELLFAPCEPFAQLLANADSWLLAWIVAAVHTIASLPYATLRITPPPAWAIAAYDTALVAALWFWKREARLASVVALAAGVCLVFAPPLQRDTRLRITVLDVGQADAIVIQTPSGHTFLVDAGGKLERGSGIRSSAENVGERIVVPFLRRAGVRHVDAVILSHPHGDHAGGVAPVLRAFGVTEFADSGQHYGGYAYNDALQTARAQHLPLLYPRAGMVWRTNDGITLTFIGPSLPFIESDNTINDNSVAFILQYKHFRMLFTGDAGVAAEQRLLNEDIHLHADVLKVGHHGSGYSSSPAFIAAVHPKYAIISVGRHNMFGHPAALTIDTLERFRARVYRTDQNGAVGISSDGYKITISEMLP